MDRRPVYADISTSPANTAYLGHAAAYTTLSRSHRAAALDGPSHLSLRFAFNSSQRAQQSRRAAQRSRARAQDS
jgi:hypothetical protein